MVFMGVEELVIRLRTVNELGGFDQLANRIQSIDSLINKFSSKVSDISKSIISELSKIDNIDFNKITTNFQSVSDKLGSDAQKASQIATAELSKINTVDFNRISSYSQAASQIATNELSKINTVQFNKLYNNFKSISDIIGRDSRTASQIATSELAKINTIDFNNISNKFKAATGQMNNDAMSAADSSTSQLQKINMLDFSGLSNKFKSAVQQMANDARSVADTVSSSFQNMSQGLDGMVTGLGGLVGMNKLFQESQQKAALSWRMNNITSSDEASKITSAYVQYDISSSRADADLTTMMNLLVGSGELTSKNTARSLGILDAISANADPLKQRGAMYGFGAYLSGGYESAKGKLRDEGLTDSQLERMEAAKTYQERLNVLEEIALERGQLQIGQNGELVGLYNTMTGEIGGYNKALALLDRVVQAGTEAFMGFMNVLSPVFDFLSNLPEPVWDLIGVLTVAAGAGAIFLGGLSALGTIIPFLTGGFGVLVSVLGVVIPGFSGSAAAMRLSAVAAGEASVSFGLLGSSIWTALAPVLPFVAAAAAIVGAIYLIGDALGYWKDLPSMFAAISDGLSRIWDSFVNNKYVIGVINAITSAWDNFVNFFVNGWNSIFGQDIGGNFDVVRGIIDTFGLLGDAIAGVWDYLVNDPVGQFITTLLTMGNPILFVATHFEWLKSTVMDVWNFISGVVQNNPLLNILTWLNPITILLFHLNDLKLMFNALQQAWNEFFNSTQGKELFSSLSKSWAEVQAAFSEIGAVLGELWNILFPPDVSSKGESAKQAVNGVKNAIQEANPYIETAKTIIHGFAWVLQNLVLPTLRGLAIALKGIATFIRVVAGGIQWLKDKWDDFSNGDFNIGQMISDTITNIDWINIGITLATSLWEGVKSVLMANPITKMLLEGADALTGGALLGNDKGATPPQNANPLIGGLNLPTLDWSTIIPSFSWTSWLTPNSWSSWLSPNNWGSWLSPNNWGRWLSPNNWGSWLSPNRWSSWLTSNKWGSWITSINWSSFITPVNLSNFVSGIFGAGSPGYVNTDFGKGDLYEGPSYDYSGISSDSFVDSSSSNSSSVVNSNNTVHVTVEGNVDSDDRADDVANRVLSEMAFGLNKDNNANGR